MYAVSSQKSIEMTNDTLMVIHNVTMMTNEMLLTYNFTFDNSTLDEYIARHLGARHLPLTTIVPISVVYACIFIVGVLGNVSTCLVIYKNKYMQTPTNVYLANLAISDLLTHIVGENRLHCTFAHAMK